MARRRTLMDGPTISGDNTDRPSRRPLQKPGFDKMDIQGDTRPHRLVVRNLRWWIGALLFASTVINYIDRQTLSVLAPYLKAEYHWNNQQFALVIIAFRAAYSIGQAIA